jgi:uncharacterized membrane protein
MLEKIAEASSWLVYLLLFIVTYIAAHIILKLQSAAQRSSQKASRANRRRRASPFGLLLALVLILAASAVVLFSAFLRSYHDFTQKEMVAIVECVPQTNNEFDFAMTVIPVVRQKQMEMRSYPIKGDQWAIGGDILKWKDIVNFLGLHTMYRLDRVEGRYKLAEDAQTKQVSAYPLGQEQRGRYWSFLYKFGHKLPFVTAVYGNTVYMDPVFGEKFEIYVTTSGFMAQRGGETTAE